MDTMSSINPIFDQDTIAINLDKEEVAALEGWRVANNCDTTHQAVRVLLRLGLLSEIAKVYENVSTVRDAVGESAETHCRMM